MNEWILPFRMAKSGSLVNSFGGLDWSSTAPGSSRSLAAVATASASQGRRWPVESLRHLRATRFVHPTGMTPTEYLAGYLARSGWWT